MPASESHFQDIFKKFPRCAETLLCHLNFRIKSKGSKLKTGFAKAISVFASWYCSQRPTYLPDVAHVVCYII
jgi:hypothetical protein